MLARFKNKVLPIGKNKAYVNRQGLEEYAYPADRRMDEKLKTAKMKAGTELDNLLATAEYVEHQEDDGRHEDAVRGWDKYKTQFIVDEQLFEGEISLKLTQRGDVFYDMSKIKNITPGTSRSKAPTSSQSDVVEGKPSTSIITEKDDLSTKNAKKVEKTSTGRASLAVDSAGNALTAEQAEYFKDSKVRDEDGNLMVVYHGTMEDFTVFDIKKARSYDETLDYDLPAFYFSQSTEEGGSYGKAKPYYVNIKNPYNGDLWALKKEYGSWRKVYDYLVEQGYAGVIYDDLGDGYNEYLAFHPNQIKLTTNKAPTKKADIRYSLNVDLAKKTSDRVQTIVRDKGVVRQTISDIREGKKSVKET